MGEDVTQVTPYRVGTDLAQLYIEMEPCDEDSEYQLLHIASCV